MISLHIPAPAAAHRFIERQQVLPFTYPDPNVTRNGGKIARYDHDLLEEVVGKGHADFEKAKNAIRQWVMFPVGWTVILPRLAPILPGQTVAMYARAFGLWWRNACRIVYVVDEPGRFGFAYGTLPGHIEKGEELFLVSLNSEGQVVYTIRAVSHPRHWLARVAYPLMRYFQARFRTDSARAIRQYIRQTS